MPQECVVVHILWGGVFLDPQEFVHILWGGASDPQEFVHILGGRVGWAITLEGRPPPAAVGRAGGRRGHPHWANRYFGIFATLQPRPALTG